MSTTKEKKKRDTKWVSDLRYGQSLSLQYFKTNAWPLLLVVAIVIAMIGLRYSTMTKMEQIKKLNVELQKSESRKLHEKALYMSLIRESEMRKLVSEKQLGLDFQEQPPYTVIRE